MSRAVVTLLSEVQPQAVDWLWESRIPLGMLTVFDGDPGLGKSTVLLDLAARLSRGDSMPDGTRGPHAAGTVILTAEDDLARVVRPRLDAAGADTTRITVVRVQDGETAREPDITAEDLTAVEEAVEWVGARLLIVDPLMAYLPADVNANRDQDVRRALVHLRALAERTGVAVVVVRHLNKARGGPALYRGGGSIGIIGAVRSGLLLAADPAAPDGGRVLAVMKSNLAPMAPSVRLYITQGDGRVFPRVSWGDTCDLSAAHLLAAAEKPKRRSARTEAMDFLRGILAQGPVPAKEVEGEATDLGIAVETLRRARRELGVTAKKVGRPTQPGQQWLWNLPQEDSEGNEGEVAEQVTPSERDLLQAPDRDAHADEAVEPKKVNPVGDPLQPSDRDFWAAADAAPKEVNVVVDPLRAATGNGHHGADDAPKAVTPIDDPLQELAGKSVHEAVDGSEEGQAAMDEALHVSDLPEQLGAADYVCPDCGGRMLQWSWGRVCTSCRRRVPGNDLTGSTGEPAFEMGAAHCPA